MSSEARTRPASPGLTWLGRLRRSVAVRLSLTFALLFTVGFTAMFGILYWLLGRQLEQREYDALSLRLQSYAVTFNTLGVVGLNMRFNEALIVNGFSMFGDPSLSQDKSIFVRVVAPNGDVVFKKVPTDWTERDWKNVAVPEGWERGAVQQQFNLRESRDHQEDMVVVSTVLPSGALLQVARTSDNRTALLQPLRRTFTRVGVAVVLVGFFIGWLAAGRAVKPLQGVVDTARRIIATGALDARVDEPKRDNDIAELVRLFNTMLDKNSALLRSMRDSLDNVAHDLRTPLTSMRGTAELALASGSEPSMRDALADNVERADEVLRLLRALMEISEADSGVMKLRKEPCDLGALARDAADLYSDVADARSQTLRVAIAPAAANESKPGGNAASGNAAGGNAASGASPLIVSGDPIRLRQVIANLVDNALKYTQDGGQIDVTVREDKTRGVREGETRGGREGVVICVRDDGPGVPEVEQGRIWERLYRGDQSRSQSGLGLGLSLVRAIVEAHGGTASVRNAPAPARGAIFEVWLPR